MRALKADSNVVVELAELNWADTSLMLDLMILARRLRMQSRTLVLRDAQPQIMALLELVGLDRSPSILVEHSAPAPVAALV